MSACQHPGCQREITPKPRGMRGPPRLYCEAHASRGRTVAERRTVARAPLLVPPLVLRLPPSPRALPLGHRVCAYGLCGREFEVRDLRQQFCNLTCFELGTRGPRAAGSYRLSRRP